MNSKIISIGKINFKAKNGSNILSGILIVIFLLATVAASVADDTDIYRPKVKHNVMILMDSSGSMAWPLYEHTIDYAAFYDYICVNRSNWTNSYDETNGQYGTNAYYYNPARKKTRTKIYLMYGNTGYASPGLTGDAGKPDLIWKIDESADMLTYLNSDGELEDAAGKSPGEVGYAGRIGTEVDGATGLTMITVDGQRLPNGKDIALHSWRENPDRTRIDNGFSGLVQAPGYYFSGYFRDNAVGGDPNLPVNDAASTYTSLQSAAATSSGREQCYFFATGNWINMQMIFNLQVYAGSWKDAWTYCSYPPGVVYQTVPFNMVSKNYPANYPSNYDSNQDTTVNYVIYNALSSRMRIHFSDYLLWYSTTTKKDRIELYDENGSLVYTYHKNNLPSDKWSLWITGKRILVRFVTHASSTGTRRWKIDQYQYESIGTGGTYKFDTRLEVAKAAIIDVIETTRGKINWGLMSFDKTGNADGGELPPQVPINPSFNDDQQKQNIIVQLGHIDADGGTPLGEALQDAFTYFNSHPNQIHRDCNKNFIITLTDGFPSADTEWARILSTLNFQTNPALHDGVQYTQDPMQYATPTNDYYDDVAGYLYSHSWLDYSDIPAADREGSADNIAVHNIGFSLDSPMLQHASDIAGGVYLTAYSKSQLISAFYSLGLLIGEYTSYTAPVVSVDEANRVQSGDKLYMALFKPNEDTYWSGNLKKYGLAFGVATGCNRAPGWYVVDSTGKEATTCDGVMLEETASFWSTYNDGGDVEKGGTGKILYDSIPATIVNPLTLSVANFRNIYTTIDGVNLVRVATDTISNANLGVSTDAQRYKIINFLYGYTYDAHDAVTGPPAGAAVGAPVAKNGWPIGPIIHSTPKIIDYMDSNGDLTHRYIAVGSNDGMLHFFNDADGREIFAFVPPAALPIMQQFDPTLTTPNRKVYTVDGSPMLIKDSSGNLLLVFGLRRGGRAYYALDITDPNPGAWRFRWQISNTQSGMEELGYSMPMPQTVKIKTGVNTYKNLLLVPGGYDMGEDRPDNSDYYLTSTHHDIMGRGIFLVDTDTGLLLPGTYFGTGSQFVWPQNNSPSGVIAQMKYCFAADPTVISDPQGYLLAAYITDLYGQVWKLRYELSDYKFYLNLIFKMNPMTDQKSDYELRSAFSTWSSGEPDPRGVISFVSYPIRNPRKTFYSPDVSYAGNCFTDLPVLFMGTGDREHPTFTGIYSPTDYSVKNGLYSFYDAHAYFKYYNPSGTYNDSSNYFTEKDLLNVTCGAMEPDVVLSSNAAENSQIKANIKTFLMENAKGWYLLFSKLNGCYGVDNTSDTSLDHIGEKSISPVTLFAKVVYAPTFQPLAASADPCAYDNLARLFAIDYCTGNAAYNLYSANDVDANSNSIIEQSEKKFTRLDRYLAIGDHIPSGVSIVIRYGKAAGFISVGGKIYPLPEIKMPGAMIPIYWRQIFR